MWLSGNTEAIVVVMISRVRDSQESEIPRVRDSKSQRFQDSEIPRFKMIRE